MTPLYDGEIVVSIAATPLDNCPVNVAGPHARSDDVPDDPMSSASVRALSKTVADVDSCLVVLHEEKEHRAVVAAHGGRSSNDRRFRPVHVSNGTSPVVCPIQTIT